MKRKRHLLIILLIIAVLIGTYVIFPGFHAFIRNTFNLLASADIGEVRDYLLSFGVWAPVISILLMILSVLIPPLPAFVPTLVNGLLFGVFWGGILSWTSGLLGATLAFYLGRVLGRPIVEKVASQKTLNWADHFFTRYGVQAVITARVIPIVSYGVISYAAGLTSIRFSIYVLGTAIGQTPATILYSYLGEHAAESVMVLFWIFGIIIVMAVLGSALKPWLEKNSKQKQ